MSGTGLAHGRRDDGAGHARFALHDDPATRAIWPHPFAAELSVTIFGDTLETALLLRNTGDAPFTFTAALHSYLRVTDVGTVSVPGLPRSDERRVGTAFVSTCRSWWSP